MKLVWIGNQSHRADTHRSQHSDIQLGLYPFYKSEIRLINLEDIKMLITDHVRFYNFHDNK